MVVNISEACAHLGYRSRSTVQRLIKAGHLNAYLRPGGGRAVLLETDPEGMPSLRSAVQGLTQIRYDSPLWKRERKRTEPVDLELLSDEALAAYCDEHLSDDALEAAMAPITACCDSQASLDWELIAEHLNAYLGDSWPAPPYSADQASTLAMVLSLAEEAAADG
jgi:hypothetical protein